MIGVAGESIGLPCNISLAKLRDVDLVLWYLGSSGKPIFTLDARGAGSALGASSTSTGPSMSSNTGRVYSATTIGRGGGWRHNDRRWLQLPGKRLEGRAQFNYSQESSSSSPPRSTGPTASGTLPQLIIQPLEAPDAGLYKCRVDYKQSRTDYFLVNLTVIGRFLF